MAESKSPKQLRVFVGMINYYKSLWPQRNLKLTPLTEMTGKGATFKWTKVNKEAFSKVKAMVAQDTMLTHPNYKEPFVVHIDASKLQIRGVVSQDKRPLGYISIKCNAVQYDYTMTEKELLGIVKIFKYFKIILLG